jgi:peptide deformylase
MGAKKIFRYPHDALRKVSSPESFSYSSHVDSVVEELDDAFKETIGLALAHCQISDDSTRAFMCSDQFAGKLALYVFNPQIISVSKEKTIESEGCLSFPNIWLPIERYDTIEVVYNNWIGDKIETKLTGLAARMFQHEVDHLDGKLIVDYVDRKKKFQIRSMMLKGR